jgi:hypothetical protein
MKILAIMVLALTASAVQADVINQVGGKCPTGFHKSGSYCKPFSSQQKSGQTTVSNPGRGSCPSGYYSSGNFCKSFKSESSKVVSKSGDNCPIGFFMSGEGFCKKY